MIWRELGKELAKRFPEFVHSITIVNTPMFFENFYNGGTCNCIAQCIYSDKGPWSFVLNCIDFQNRQYTTTEAEFHENIQAREEFKMLDNDSDDE